MGVSMQRHYGMDWLRIGAFAILILYHVALVFSPWPFHAKSRHIADDVEMLPLFAANAWRLTLLFVVSGYATRALLARAHGLRAFAGDRTRRLLIPLAFGVAVVVPPQGWVELVTQHGYQRDFVSFWLRDWFSFRRLDGVPMPAWNHLWFVGYLWAYTMLLTLSVAVVRPLRWQHWFNRAFAGPAVLLLPLAWYAAIHGWWFLMAAETHGFIDDPMAHMEYGFAFLFGFGLARSERVMAAVVRWHRVAAVLAAAGYGWTVAAQLGAVPFRGGDWLRVYGLAHAIEQWGAIVALIGFAERHWNRDLPIRRTLTEAVFPFYLVHQTIIVLVAGALLGAGLSMAAESTILIAATVAGCWGFYLVGRRIGPLRPLIGLRARA
jgi:glucans biosynthesis protein C